MALLLGTAISQGILLGFTPVLTRIYTPENFGIYALFLSITAILSLMGTLRYEMAIILPEKQQDANSIAQLCVFLTFVFSLFILLVTLFFKDFVSNILHFSEHKNLLFFIPLAVFLTGIYNTLYYLLIRKKKYSSVAYGLVSKASTTSVMQWMSSAFPQSSLGLILGQIIGIIAGLTFLFKARPIVVSPGKWYDKSEELRNQALRYVRFPKYTLPGNLLNTLFLNGLPFIIIYFFTSFVLGQFILASRMLGIPFRVIGSSISQVYFQKIAASKNQQGNVLSIYIRTLWRLLIIAIPVFGLLFISAPSVFEFVFGEEWKISGTYAQILIPVMAARFVSSSLSPTLHVFERQDLTLNIQSIQLLTLFILCAVVYLMKYSFTEMLTLYSWVYSLEYVLFLYVYYYIVKKNTK